jgi:hypothetical protein
MCAAPARYGIADFRATQDSRSLTALDSSDCRNGGSRAAGRSAGLQIEQMEAARSFLQHVRTFHPDAAPDGCGHYEALMQNPQARHDRPE